MMLSKAFAKIFSALSLLAAFAPMPATAVPLLQLYIEGAVYDPDLEGWLADGLDPVRLWAIGNVAGPGGTGTIGNVRLAIAYDAPATPVTLSLTASTTGGYSAFFDPSTSPAATYLQTVTDGSVPVLSDGGALPSHGIYDTGVHWQEFLLGNFTLTDSPIADFITSFPAAPTVGSGQINVYEVSVSGTYVLHFDLYDSIQAKNGARAIFAPFSHDADSDDTPPCCGPGPHDVPEPSPAPLMALGLLALVFIRRRVA